MVSLTSLMAPYGDRARPFLTIEPASAACNKHPCPDHQSCCTAIKHANVVRIGQCRFRLMTEEHSKRYPNPTLATDWTGSAAIPPLG